MKQRGFVQFVILGVVVLAVVAAGAFYVGKQTSSKPAPSLDQVVTPQATPSPSPVADETANPDLIGANWKTYRNTKLGVSFKYPIDGKIEEGGSYGVDNVFLEDPNSISLLIDDGQMIISVEQTEKKDIESFMSDYKSFDREIGLDYEGNKVEKVYIDGIQALKGASAGPKSNIVFTLMNNNKVYRISFEPWIGKSGRLILNNFKFLE